MGRVCADDAGRGQNGAFLKLLVRRGRARIPLCESSPPAEQRADLGSGISVISRTGFGSLRTVAVRDAAFADRYNRLFD